MPFLKSSDEANVKGLCGFTSATTAVNAVKWIEDVLASIVAWDETPTFPLAADSLARSHELSKSNSPTNIGVMYSMISVVSAERKAHPPLVVATEVNHGVEVVVTENHRNRTAPSGWMVRLVLPSVLIWAIELWLYRLLRRKLLPAEN